MTVKEVKDILETMPEDSIVLIQHESIADVGLFVEKIEIDEHGDVWIK